MKKPNCYKCKHRGNLSGTHHSSCQHPLTKSAHDDPLSELMAIFGSVGRVAPMNKDTGLNVVGSAHGIAKGWFQHPYNFDPIWLESCDGFKSKGEEK